MAKITTYSANGKTSDYGKFRTGFKQAGVPYNPPAVKYTPATPTRGLVGNVKRHAGIGANVGPLR